MTVSRVWCRSSIAQVLPKRLRPSSADDGNISHLELDANTLNGTFPSKLKNFGEKKLLPNPRDRYASEYRATENDKRIIVTTTAK